MNNLFVRPKLINYKSKFLISQLIVLFNYVRNKTIQCVSGLSINELDYFEHNYENSIGILLKHIAAIEKSDQIVLFENRVLTYEENIFWYGSLPGQLILKVVKGNPIEYYLDLLQEVRIETLANINSKTDSWLYERAPYKSDRFLTNYECLFHMLEDEMNHVGQIKMKKIILRNTK